MISDISKTVMKTINAIQKHREKFGNDEVIIRYYKTHGSFDGIIEFLKDVENKQINSQQ